MANKKISELSYINGSKISGNTLVPLVTYFSAATGDTVHTFVDDLQTYLISGLTGQTEVFVTGGTYSAGTITFTNTTGGTFNVTGLTTGSTSTISGDFLPLSGGTVTGDTIFTQGLSATTISATTYLNLPITTDVFVTGGTYSNGDATFTNNTGGTFNVSGFYTGETSYVNSLNTGNGLSADTTTGNITIINTDPDQVVTISGGTGITTGGTYPNFTITNSLPDQTVTLGEGSNISVTGTYPNFTIDVTGLTDNDIYITGFTYDDNNTFTISKNSGSSLNATINIVSGLTVNGNLTTTTISATTYQNLPLGIYGTGLTFNTGNYDLTIDGGNGILDTVSLSILASDLTVTGGTYNPNTGIATFTNNTGGTFNVTGFLTGMTDTFVTGGTYSAGTITFTNTSGGTFEVSGLTTNTNIQKTLFVDPNGSDTTGTKGVITKPFLTLEAAKSAATTGDTIYVFPGTYTVTTTATEGLAKDGILYYFSPGCTVNKSSAGDMFRVSSFTTGFSVYGYGNFNKTSTAASILYVTSTSVNVVFQANDLTTSTSSVIFDIRSASKCYLDFKNSSSTAGSVINLDNSNITIEMHSMTSTTGPVFIGSAGGAASHFSNCNLNVSGYLVETTATSNYCILLSSSNIVNINVDYIKSATLNYGLSSNGLGSTVTITTSYISGINANYVQPTVRFNLNGYSYSLIGKMYLEGGQVGRINISEGDVNTNYVGTQDNSSTATITVSGGKVTLQMQNQDPTSGLAVSGGILTLNGNWTNDDMAASSDLTGGVLIINGDYEYGGPSYAQTRYYGIKVNGGSLFLNGTIRVNFPSSLGLTSYTSLFASPIEFNSGKIIINGGTLISNISNTTPIRSTASGLSIKVYAGGMNTNLIANGGTLVGKKMKVKFTVSSVATTSITVNDGLGSGDLTFTETNTGAYNTTALLSQRMVSLINASVTLQTTASQDTPGTDSYFYLEQDAINSGYTLVSSTNLGGEGLVPGMFALNQSVLGTIIEDTDIE